MPPIGLLLGPVDFRDRFIDLSGTSPATLAQAEATGAAVLRYGLFINAIVNFLIVAFADLPRAALGQAVPARASRSRRARMPALPVAHSARGQALPALRIRRRRGLIGVSAG